MKKKKCVIFSNGQGLGLQHFLNKSPQFRDYFDVFFLYNYKSNWHGKELPSELIKRSSLMIYQDLHDDNIYLPFKDVRQFFQNEKQTISFPNIYFSGLWPFFEEGEDIVSGKEIIDIINNGHSLKSIIQNFCSLSIFFDFEKRFLNSKNQLIRNESNTNIKFSDFILEHIRDKKLFLTQNHPTSTVFIFAVNQILSLLNLPHISCECTDINEANLPGYWPSSPYDCNYYNFSYKEAKNEEWKFFYSFIITRIYFGIGAKEQSLKRSLVKKYIKYLTHE